MDGSMKRIIYDIEVYPNRLCVALLIDGYLTVLDTEERIRQLPLEDPNYLWIGFNNRRYDHPILQAIQKGGWVKKAYYLSDQIINQDNECITWNTNIVDLLEICPQMSKASLKEFGHRLKYPILQNLPYPFAQELNDEEWEVVKQYCKHDVNITQMLWEKLKEEYYARQSLKKFFDIKTEYGGAPNLAQKSILSQLGDEYVDRSNSLYKQDNIVLPSELMTLYDEAFAFPLEEYKEKKKPDFMNKGNLIDVNGCHVQFGVGGCHGFQKAAFYKNVYEYDVSSFYPSVILKCRLGGAKFRSIYERIYKQRLYLKKNKMEGATALKLVLNSLFGKLISPYSHPKIQAPNIGLAICLLGQFYMMDLITKLPANECIYANTDGIIVRNPIDSAILNEWQERTELTLECTLYKTLILKDVNSYYAVDDKGKIKRRKEFRTPAFTHNVKAPIIQKAVLNNLLDHVPIEDTVMDEKELYNFCFFTKVPRKGDKKLLLDSEPLEDPKVRYYISHAGHILERETPKQKARVCKDSPIKLAMNLAPIDQYTDINYNWYIKKASQLVEKIRHDGSPTPN